MSKCDILLLVIGMELKAYRIDLGITAKEASVASNVPLRTYIRYENDDKYGNILKRKQILFALQEKYGVSEEKGVLSVEKIKEKVNVVLSAYKEEVVFCYLFGSYAKGYATDTSDIDLCVSTSLTGLAFVGLIEELRKVLNKKIDLLRLSDLTNNEVLIQEIMKDGIKIYG